MATEQQGTFAGAFCGLDDVQDVSHQRYTAGSRPNSGTAARLSRLQGNALRIWLRSQGFEFDPATVDQSSVEGIALRNVNALTAAKELIRGTPLGERSEEVPTPESLTLAINLAKDELLQHLKVSLGRGTRGLSTHWKAGDTAELTDDAAGEEESVIRKDFVRMDSRF